MHYKVAIFKHDRLGDLVLAVGAIRTVVEAYGVKECVLIVSPVAGELARLLFPELAIVVLPRMRRLWKLYHWAPYVWLWWFMKGFRDLTCDYLISLRHHSDPFYDQVYRKLSALRSFGVKQGVRRFSPGVGPVTYMYTDVTEYPVEGDPIPHDLEAHRRVLSLALNRQVLADEVVPRLDRRSETGNFLLLSPFSSDRVRDFPSGKLIDALRVVRKGSAVPFILCAAPFQRAEAEAFLLEARSAGLADVSLETPSNLRRFLDLVSTAHCVFSVDTATAHLAAAFDQPAVIILGGGHYGQFGPWQRSNRQIWLTHHLPCFHCDWRCIYSEARCITGVPLETIAGAILDRLADQNIAAS